MHTHRFSHLLLSLLGCQIVGTLGLLYLTLVQTGWYANLHQPVWALSPVWIQLLWHFIYLLLGIALYRLWTLAGTWKTQPILHLLGLLLLGLLWFIFLFGLQNLWLGLLTILLLLLLTFGLVLRLWPIDRYATMLCATSLLWIGYLSILNLWLAGLNR